MKPPLLLLQGKLMKQCIVFIAIAGALAISGCASSTAYQIKYPLHNAIYNDDFQEAQRFMASGVSPHKPDINGYYPVHIAISRYNPRILQVLIDQGVDVNVRDSSGDTPLMAAAYTCQPDVIDLLYKTDADPTCVNSEGITAYRISIHNNCPPMVAMLRRKGITESIVSIDGFDDILRRPAHIKPLSDSYHVQPNQREAYQLAIEDCNHFTVPGKKGLLLATGPLGYGLGLLKDQLTVPKKFKACMQLMGFEPTQQ